MPDLHSRTRVGKSTLEVPLLAFGTAPLATAPAWNPGDPISEAQSRAALTYAYEQGIRWFDTAPNYVHGLAETRLGQVVSALPRNQIVIATKVGFDISGAESMRDYTRDGVRRSLDSSLKRLGVDAVDLLYVHDPDDYTQQVLDVTFPALAELRAQGVIKAIGAGMNQWRVPMEFARHADFDCFMIAGRWTLLEQEALPLLDLCQQRGIAVFAASIYNSGILATGADHPNARYNHAPPNPAVLARVRALEAVCRQFEVPLHTVATQYPLAHPAVKALVVGFQSVREIQACLQALDQPIPAALWEQLRDDRLIVSEAPLPKVVTS
ncbi:MAG: aldo/keto reductase [Chloroflexi bacterium]|uniref:aldo/keto reductase n=1 Tax=Candidatus Flexifilum breve TaxID=3140694 RepID=UPI003134EC6F|nr:aldo/keto reductase [Chloroflexota bacterium]